MKSIKFVKKIKNYAVFSFLLPLIALNSCLLIYKFLGDMNTKVDRFPNLNWNKIEHTYEWKEYIQAYTHLETYTFLNCSKYGYSYTWTSFDNEVVEQKWKELHSADEAKENAQYLRDSLGSNFTSQSLENDKIKSVTIKSVNILNNRCIKNHPFLFSILRKFSWIETILIYAINDNPAGFGKIKNPYFYGEASISRTARYFPMIFIFKPLIILSAFLLFLYWKNNLNLFNELKNKKIFINFSKKFFYLGIFSCLFLVLHATFLGLDVDSKLFHKIRRLVLILFIIFEICAQFFLTRNLFIFKENLKDYIRPLILKIKIIFVSVVFIVTCIAFLLLGFGDLSSSFKHILEWNYFSFLLLYYFFSRLLWK